MHPIFKCTRNCEIPVSAASHSGCCIISISHQERLWKHADWMWRRGKGFFFKSLHSENEWEMRVRGGESCHLCFLFFALPFIRWGLGLFSGSSCRCESPFMLPDLRVMNQVNSGLLSSLIMLIICHRYLLSRCEQRIFFLFSQKMFGESRWEAGGWNNAAITISKII